MTVSQSRGWKVSRVSGSISLRPILMGANLRGGVLCCERERAPRDERSLWCRREGALGVGAEGRTRRLRWQGAEACPPEVAICARHLRPLGHDLLLLPVGDPWTLPPSVVDLRAAS